jgi:hypothetical protein
MEDCPPINFNCPRCNKEVKNVPISKEEYLSDRVIYYDRKQRFFCPCGASLRVYEDIFYYDKDTDTHYNKIYLIEE